MPKVFSIQFSLQVVLYLIGLGFTFMPNMDNWIPSIVIWIIATVWLIVTLIVWHVHKRRKAIPPDDISIESADYSIKLAQLLRQSDERLELLRRKAAKRFITVQQIIEISISINNVLGISDEDIAGYKDRAKELINIQRKQAEFKPRAIYDTLLNKLFADTIYSATDGNKIINTLDSWGFGLSKMRNSDRIWNNLYKAIYKIADIYKDAELYKFISDCVDASYILNSLFLLYEYMRRAFPTGWMPTEIMASDLNNPKFGKDKYLSDLIIKVSVRLKELQNVPNQDN